MDLLHLVISKISAQAAAKGFFGLHLGRAGSDPRVNELLEDIINYIPHHVFWKDKEGVFLGCNKHFARAAGYEDPSEMIGKTDFDMPWRLQAEKYRQDDKAVMSAGIPQLDIEDIQTRKDGSEIVALVSKVPLFDSEKRVTGLLGIYADITDRKKRELELAHQKKLAEVASRAKSEFISNISHDIRTPISGMLGLIHSIRSRVQDKEIQEDADLLMNSTNKLLDLLNEILEVVQLESSQNKTHEETFNFRQLIDNNFALLKPAVKSQSISLKYNYPENLPVYFVSNRLFINRILMNLLGNAVKFTHAGEIALNVVQQEERQGISTLRVSITDTGIGIPSEKFEEIFEHFSRLTPAYQGIYQGSGMGLYTVKRYLEELGGTVDVQSEIGKGSTFTVTLSLKKATPEEISVFKAEERAEQKTAKMPNRSTGEFLGKILVVEDQVLAMRMAVRLLEELHCEVDTAMNAREAIKQIEHNDYSMILMDIGLPDGDGMAICSKIRGMSDPRKSKVPIIALTAHLDSEIEKTCREVGMQSVITKPLTALAAQNILKKYT